MSRSGDLLSRAKRCCRVSALLLSRSRSISVTLALARSYSPNCFTYAIVFYAPALRFIAIFSTFIAVMLINSNCLGILVWFSYGIASLSLRNHNHYILLPRLSLFSQKLSDNFISVLFTLHHRHLHAFP